MMRAYPDGITISDHIHHDMNVGRFPQQSSVETFLRERASAMTNPHTPEPENAEDRIATQAKAKAMSDKCGIPEDDDEA